MDHLFHAMFRSLLRRVGANIATVTLLFGIALIGWLVSNLYPQLSGSDAASRQKALEILLLAVSASSVLFLAAQLRQQATWNKVLSYHQFFHDLPSPSKASDMTACLARLDIPKPTAFAPVTADQVNKIRRDMGNNVANSSSSNLTAEVAIKAYLDDFEEFCGAVKSGVVSDWYAISLEGARVIRAYFAFAPLINQLKQEAEEAAQAATEDRQTRSKYYDELKDVAKRWSDERKSEHIAAQTVEDWAKDKGATAQWVKDRVLQFLGLSSQV